MKRKWIWILLGLALCAAACWALLLSNVLPRLRHPYTVNAPDSAAGESVPAAMSLYSADSLGFSFLYPAGMETGWREGDGAILYAGAREEAPYVLVCRAEGRDMNPERYFKGCNELMLENLSGLRSTPIQEVVAGGKTLYMTRYQGQSGGRELTVDRYLELYPGFYLQYTALSDTPGSLDTPLYYAIATLRVAQSAYEGAYSPRLTEFRSEDTGLRLSVPEMLSLRELTIGCLATGENAVLLCVRCTQDDAGNPLYNRQDFIDRAAASPGFVAGLLGSDSATFTEGTQETLGGRSFYRYPMVMETGGERFTGSLRLANAGETGCWLLCTAVREDCPAYDDLQALCEESAQSIRIDE